MSFLCVAPRLKLRRSFQFFRGVARPALHRFHLVALFMLLTLTGGAADNVIISEFMASNKSTLLDGNGNFSDWIELYNAGDAAVDLTGWHLTDNPLDPVKWTFPGVMLGPGQFLLVFASGNGVPDATGKLHASFQLASNGDYLALVRPDNTIATEFSPAFPPQRDDISYGFAQQMFTTTLVSTGARARLLIPTAAAAPLGSLWTGGNEPFNDSAWLSVTNPIGYDAPPVSGASLINVALGRPVIAAGDTWPGLPKENLTDGNTNTFTHNNIQVPDFYFIVDLGGAFKLENIELFNRNDGCCPDRLTNYTVSIHADTGATIGPAVWSANLRTNGSNSGIGGRDLVTPNLDPAGTFAGRWIKVAARTNSADRYFQIAELRANAANWARGATVLASGPTDNGAPKENITDGDPATYSHNLDLTPAFAYQIRLTQSVTFTRLEIFNRTDGCCPDRLSNYRVSVHPDNAGSIGPALWSADIRTDNSNSGVSGVDVLTADLDAGGSFEGQWIQIQNLDLGVDRYLQIAEVRAFGFGGSSGYSSFIRRDVTAEMKGVNSSAWLRVPFNATNSGAFDRVTLRLKYDDGFVAYVNGTEVARANAPAGVPAYNAAATTGHFAAVAEEFAVPLNLLHDGTNLLALHGLNLSASDRDFLLFPELIAHTSTSGGYGYMLTPTPGLPNSSNVVAGFVDDPRFSIDRGFFDTPFDVVITSPTPGATLVYTTNSAKPALTNGAVLVPSDANSSISATVRVSTTTILRAAAFKTGLQSSKIDTHTYLFLSDVIRQPANPSGFPATWNGFTADYQMDPKVVTNATYGGEIIGDLRSIPTMSIVLNPPDLFGAANGIYTFSDQVGDAWERAASVEFIKPDGTTGFQADCGIRVWGTGWRPHGATPKHALQLKFQDQYGPKKLHYPIFPDAPVAEFDNLVLRAQGSRSWCDSREPDREQTQYIHDAWARDTARAMGKTDGEATYVHLYLNGLYWGLYNPVEKTDEGFAQLRFGGDKSEYDVITRRGAPEVDAGTIDAWNQMLTIVNAGLATPEQYSLVQQYLDVDDLIDYMMLNQYASNHDGPLSTIANNMRAIRRRVPGGQFRFFVWDMEYTFWYPLENNLGFDYDQSPARIFQNLRANPEFRLRFADHAQRHLLNNGALTPGPAAARWQARATEIFGAVVGESARWGDVRRATPPYTRNVEWTIELNRLLNEYFPVRTQVLLDQYKAAGLYPSVVAPSFNQPGGDVPAGFNLAIAAPAGTVYFTTNGLDPRLAGGGISADAVAFTPTTPLVTTASVVRVFVPSNDTLGRTWNGSDPNFDDSAWLSGPNAAGFDVTTPAAPFTVPLQNAAADFSEANRGVNLAIDASPATTGWGIFEQQDYLPKGRGAVAVFETFTNIGFTEGTRLIFTLRHGITGQLTLGKFRLSATTDDRSQFADGLANRGDITANWQPLAPLSATASAGGVMTINADGTILVSGANPQTNVYTITIITPLTGITGFRLEAMEDTSLPSNGPGRSGNGDAVVTDFSVQAAPATLAPLLDAGFASQLQGTMQNQNASAYVRIPFSVEANAIFHHLTLRVRYEDGFIAYLNGQEVARRNAPASPVWNSAAVMPHAKGQALEFEIIDLGDGLTNLIAGANVLAFHALNDTAVSPDFLLQAELVARTDLPIGLTDSLTVKARVLLDGVWSALNEATFTARVPLRITEIMYNPPGEGFVSGDEFEFLELKNVGSAAFNLGGLTFTSGISFTFTNGTWLGPGQFFVLVRNAAQFGARYPGVTIGGVYAGKLDNGGEALTISRLLGGTLLSVTYGDSAPWPAAADGLGFSLVPKNPAANPDPNNSVNWRASGQPFGSPGADDPDPNLPGVFVNEVLSAGVSLQLDAIELYNPTANAVNIGGWFLTDDPALPMKFRIPDNTTIAAGGYAVFDEHDFNPAPGTTNNFQLNAAGESVHLFSGDANTNLTGYSHGFNFGAAAPGVSFGRYVISTGEEQFPAQSALTLHMPNAGPRIGPVVISEIMYHPPPGGDEFIELKNITGSPVELFDPAHPTNTWTLAGLNYTFPTNVTLAANAFLLVAPNDPATFRAKYGVPPVVQILGPYTGQLQDSGELLELKRPDVPTTNGVNHIVVDEVRYNDKTPWPPLADGFGPSLQKINSALYGNDPANWRAAAPSPGADFAGGVTPTITVQPVSQSVVRYQNALLSVGASGTAPLHHQWRFQGTNLPDATSATLTLTNVQLTQAGPYTVVVFNGAGGATSTVATLTVLIPPIISTQPQGRIVALGTNVMFSVTASGNVPLSYQWRFNGTNLAGETGSTLTLINVQEGQNGDYTVRVTDSVGFIDSQPATLTVMVKPAITVPLQNIIAVVGDTVSFSVSASGSLPLGYRWRRSGATYTNFLLYSHTSVLTLTNVQLNQAANYAVVITNLIFSSGVTTNATLTVLADTDGDHVPDVWETQFGFNLNDPADGLADPDHDGMSNLAEYLAGTDPHDPLSYLKIDALNVNVTPTLIFSAVSNKTYTVQYRDDLSLGQWLRLTNVLARPTNRIEMIVEPGFTTRRYYRLVTPAQP